METTKDLQYIATADQFEIEGGDGVDLALGGAIGVALVAGAVASGPLLLAAAGYAGVAACFYMLRI